MKSLRWRMMTLLMIGSIINYLTRSTLGVAAPTILQDLDITTQQYSWIVSTFQFAIMLQPICGYVLDVVGLKVGFAMFAIAWSIVSMAHGLANSWPAFAVLRGLLGFAEGSANPAGMKATAEWFPARERGLAGGLFNLGASAGSMLAPPLVVWAILTYNWQAAFVMTGLIGLAWVGAVADLLPLARSTSEALRRRTRLHRLGAGAAPERRRHPAVDRTHPAPAEFLGHRVAAISRRPDLGHADVLDAALPELGAALRSEADRALRLDAVPGRRPRRDVRRRREPVAAEARGAQPDQRATRRLHRRRRADDGHGLRRVRRQPVHGDRAVVPGRLRAPDALGDGDHDVVRSVQAERGRHRGGPGRHLRQRRRAGVLADDRRARRGRRLHALLHLPGRARSDRRGDSVDGRPRTARRADTS